LKGVWGKRGSVTLLQKVFPQELETIWNNYRMLGIRKKSSLLWGSQEMDRGKRTIYTGAN